MKHTVPLVLGAIALLSSFALASVAQERPDSATAHGAMSRDMPETGARLRLGTISFPTSATPAAHREFIRGMLFLHNFHYPEAAAAFRRAQAIDPGDVMSYWGEALSYTHPVWDEQDTAAARGALRRLAATPAERLAKARTPRERAWLESAEALYDADTSKARRDTLFSASLERLRERYPHDVEAQLFYALSLLGLNQGDRDVPTYLRAYAIARRVFIAHPNHPGAAHYLIHSVDDPAHAALGLAAARAYSRIAPDAAHAQHMTSHIFIALGMWDDVIAANLRSQHSGRPGAPHTYGHGAQWLIYALIQEGRLAEATAWIDSMRTQTDRLAQAGSNASEAAMESRAYLALDRSAFVVETRAWNTPLAAIVIDTAEMDLQPAAANDLALGLAALNRGDREHAAAILAGLRTRIARARAHRGDVPLSELGYAEVMEKMFTAAMLHADARVDSAVNVLLSAAVQDDSLPFAFGPPVEIESPHEVAGQYLLALGRPAEAASHFQAALARGPGRTASLIGLAEAEAAVGQRADAQRSYVRAAKNLSHADSSAAGVLVELRERLARSGGSTTH